jgi:NAD(P)-dependent dehydrogenase (short-subunit alcohol dehydrogenase family)
MTVGGDQATAPALADKVALITGAGSGIGLEVARRFVRDGACVVGFDLSGERLDAAASELGPRFAGVTGDVRAARDLERAVSAALAAWGRLDVLVGNAGVYDGNLPLTAIPADRLAAAWRSLYEVNVLGQLHAVRAAADALIEAGGAVVLTSSHSASNPGVGGGALYASSKAAINGLVRQLAHELAPHVRVNAVAPGGTITDLRIVHELTDLAGRSSNFEDADAVARRIEQMTPLRLLPDAPHHAVLYSLLASDAARLLTGLVIESDGGTAVRGLGPRAPEPTTSEQGGERNLPVHQR